MAAETYANVRANNKRDKTYPRVWVRRYLLKQLKAWREQRDRLVVCIDKNKNIYTDQIGTELTNEDGLDMIEAVGNYIR